MWEGEGDIHKIWHRRQQMGPEKRRAEERNIGMKIHGYESNTSWEQQTSPEGTRSEQMCWCWEIAKESI